jgi:hypothetical protein
MITLKVDGQSASARAAPDTPLLLWVMRAGGGLHLSNDGVMLP